MRPTTHVLGLLSVAATGFVIGLPLGYMDGQKNPPTGKVLVPTRESAPNTLPYWACAKIVDGQLAQEDMLGLIAKFSQEGPLPKDAPPTVWHFRTAAAKECR